MRGIEKKVSQQRAEKEIKIKIPVFQSEQKGGERVPVECHFLDLLAIQGEGTSKNFKLYSFS